MLEQQPRKVQPLVAEYAHYDPWALPLDSATALQKLLSCYPRGSRVVRKQIIQWGQVRACVKPSQSTESLSRNLSPAWSWATKSEDEGPRAEDHGLHTEGKVCGFLQQAHKLPMAEVVWIGVPRSVESFLEDAVKAGHPRSLFARVKHQTLDTLVANLLTSKIRAPNKGLEKLKDWANRKADLADEEQEVRRSMDCTLESILRSKATVLLDHLLKEMKHPDQHLVEDIRNGFRLTGWMRDSKVFVPETRPPKSSVKMQLALAPVRNQVLTTKLQMGTIDDAAKKAWGETKEEVSKGWIRELERPNLLDYMVARRFGVFQGEKCRVIDDGKAAGINSTVGLPERYRLHDVTFLSALLVRAMEDPRSKGTKVLGRTLDLCSAYKQYGVCATDRSRILIAVRDTDADTIRFFAPCALPFGTTGSVSGFLRTSASTWALGATQVGLCWANYFDDYPIFALADDAGLAEECASMIMTILGIDFASSGKKATNFSPLCKSLGLLFDLERFGDGVVTLRHTEERVKELCQAIDQCLEDDKLSAVEADSLRGRLHWFSSYLFGRKACKAIKAVGARAIGDDLGVRLSPALRDALVFLKDHALHASPTTLGPKSLATYLVFSDGSLEGDEASIGGVLYDQQGNPLSFFSERICLDLVRSLKDNSAHPIFEIELIGIWASLKIWGGRVRDSFSVIYTDNEAAKGALIKGSSSTLQGNSLVDGILDMEEAFRVRAWFARVPTSANPADPPSRGHYEHLTSLGVCRVRVDVTASALHLSWG